MTTITIQNGEQLTRKKFQDIEDLFNYLVSLSPKQSFQLSSEEETELNRRYEEMKSGKELGIPWEEIKTNFKAQITS
ncbi:MAG: addiction module protein [Polaribacter sp.]